MMWKSERQRSVTFRKRIPRPPLGGLNLEGNRGRNSPVLACTALIVPPRSDCGVWPTHNWVVLVRNEIIARASQRMLEKMRAAQRGSDDGRKQ